MNLKKRINAKLKLFELLNKLNNVVISEKFGINEDIYAKLLTSIDVLKTGGLLTQNGGTYTAKTQDDDDGYYVEISGKDKNGNEYGFKFRIHIDEGFDDDTIQVLGDEIIEFQFNSNDDEEMIKMDETDLNILNKEMTINYFDIISNYIDLDLSSENLKKA